MIRALSLLAMLAILAPLAAHAGQATLPDAQVTEDGDGPAASLGMDIDAGSGQIITLPAPAQSLFVADPKVAQARPASSTTIFVFGVAPGRTSVAALDGSGHPVGVYDITVTPSAYGQNQASQAIARLLPGQAVHVAAAPNGLVLTGTVNNAMDAQTAVTTAESFLTGGQTVDNQLLVLGSIQVNLRVRIAEMSRSVTRALGINWSALGNIGQYTVNFATANALASFATPASVLAIASPGDSVEAVVNALAQDNLARMLAEPNLTAMSGSSASFLVGGEFPIPVAQQNGAVTVQFQQYGIGLSFVPTVLSSDRINLRVRPEVSALTNQGAVQISNGTINFSVDALTVRRAETTVELGSGQSFAIAGLLQDDQQHSISKLPFLGDLPILGTLFRSDSFQRNETELVIIVTPYIVKPVSDPGALTLPTQDQPTPNDIGRILLGRQIGEKSPVAPMRLPGEAGFIVQ